jgi:tRNA(Ile)-lysidine synthetase-like protein
MEIKYLLFASSFQYHSLTLSMSDSTVPSSSSSPESCSHVGVGDGNGDGDDGQISHRYRALHSTLPDVAIRLLSQWFDGNLTVKSKTLWFTADSSPTQHQIDQRLAERFGATLDRAEQQLDQVASEWCVTALGYLALILLLDQCSRHVYRHRLRLVERDAQNTTSAIEGQHDQQHAAVAAKWSAQRELNDRHSVALVDRFLEQYGAEIAHAELTPAEHIFLLMPYRHPATDHTRMHVVLQHIEVMQQQSNETAQLIQRFRKATQRRMLDGPAPSSAAASSCSSPEREQVDILEHHEFVADESSIDQSALLQSIERFVTQRHFASVSSLAVSLSGGVDSMVLCKILVHLRKKIGRQPIATSSAVEHSTAPADSTTAAANHSGALVLVAVHIDYNNRPESGAEAAFVEDWCQRHDIVFRKRVIAEAKRGVTKRDEYERVAREIRYSTYAQVMQEFGSSSMMFGHHRGDVQENVISNMMKGCSLLDLSGMHEESHVNGVCIWRPMLAHAKSDIFDFAHRFGVPYLLDTTPKWSTRGKLRNQLMPLLTEMYGDGFLQHLSALAHDSEELNQMTNLSILEPFWNSVHCTRASVYFDCAPYYSQPILFWKEALRHICHSMMGTGMIRERPIREILLERLERMKQFATTGAVAKKPPKQQHDRQLSVEHQHQHQQDRASKKSERLPKEQAAPRDCFLALRKETKSYMFGSILILYREQFFVSRPFYKIAQPVPVPLDDSQAATLVTLGHWQIHCCKVGRSSVDSEQRYKRLTLLDVSSGNFEYYLPDAANYHLDPFHEKVPYREMPRVFKAALPMVAPASSPITTSDLILRVQLKASMGWELDS